MVTGLSLCEPCASTVLTEREDTMRVMRDVAKAVVANADGNPAAMATAMSVLILAGKVGAGQVPPSAGLVLLWRPEVRAYWTTVAVPTSAVRVTA